MSGDEKAPEGNEPITIRVRDQVSSLWAPKCGSRGCGAKIVAGFRHGDCTKAVNESTGKIRSGFARRSQSPIISVTWSDAMLVFLSPPFLLQLLDDDTDRRRNFFQDQEDHQNEQGVPDLCQPKGSPAFFSSFPSWWWTHRKRSDTKDARIGRPRPNRLHAGTIWRMVKGLLLPLVWLFYVSHCGLYRGQAMVDFWKSSVEWVSATPTRRKGIYDLFHKLKNKELLRSAGEKMWYRSGRCDWNESQWPPNWRFNMS